MAAELPMSGVFGAAAVVLGVGTEEEQLAEAIDEIGPFVAIGKPDEPLPEVGAARIYVSNDEWQNRVSELMSQARLVVLRAGETANLWWEVKTAAKEVGPEKLLFLLPFTKRQCEVFRKTAKDFLPRSLAEHAAGHTVVGSRVRAILYFERDWTPHLAKIRVPLSLSTNPLVGAFRGALPPLTEQLGLELRSLRKRPLHNRLLRTIPELFLVLGVLPLPGHIFVQTIVDRSLVEKLRSAVEHNDLGYDLYQKNDLDGAIREYHEALCLYPQLVSAHSNLGLALRDKQDMLGALWECAERRLDPNLALARHASIWRGILRVTHLPVYVHLGPSLTSLWNRVLSTSEINRARPEGACSCKK